MNIKSEMRLCFIGLSKKIGGTDITICVCLPDDVDGARSVKIFSASLDKNPRYSRFENAVGQLIPVLIPVQISSGSLSVESSPAIDFERLREWDAEAEKKNSTGRKLTLEEEEIDSI